MKNLKICGLLIKKEKSRDVDHCNSIVRMQHDTSSYKSGSTISPWTPESSFSEETSLSGMVGLGTSEAVEFMRINLIAVRETESPSQITTAKVVRPIHNGEETNKAKRVAANSPPTMTVEIMVAAVTTGERQIAQTKRKSRAYGWLTCNHLRPSTIESMLFVIFVWVQ